MPKYEVEIWLLRYRQAVDDLRAAEAEYKQRRVAVMGPRVVQWGIDQVKTSTPVFDNSGMERKLARLQDLEEEILAEREKVETLKAITQAAIEVLGYSDSPDRAEILRLYYLEGLDFTAIAKRLYRADDTQQASRKRKVRRQHDRALLELSKLLPTEAHFLAGTGLFNQTAPKQRQGADYRKGITEDVQITK